MDASESKECDLLKKEGQNKKVLLFPTFLCQDFGALSSESTSSGFGRGSRMDMVRLTWLLVRNTFFRDDNSLAFCGA